jgi:hypothetical protein
VDHLRPHRGHVPDRVQRHELARPRHQDHDGYTNIEESRPLGDPKAPATAQAESVWHFPVEDDNPNVDAFNPCLPNEMSPACPRHPVTTYAPYADGSPPATFNSWPRP